MMHRRVFWMTLALCCVGATGACAAAAERAAMTVATDFEAGSARGESLDQAHRVIRFSPAGDPHRGWPCWWYFRVEGAPAGETITLEMTVPDMPDVPAKSMSPTFAMPDRPVWSPDGRTWRQFDQPGKRGGRRMTWAQKGDAARVWFAWGPPFLYADAVALVQRLAQASPHARAFELCRSREGRPVPGLVITQEVTKGDRPSLADPKLETVPRFGVWVNARQHAWEHGASWTCQGLMEWLTSDDPRAETLRKKAVCYLVPIIDVDNVAAGNGGKNQIPQDHNRDWSDQPHWPEVRAAQERIKGLVKAGMFDMFIDLHDPGANSKQPFFFYPPNEILTARAQANHERWLTAAVAEITSPLAVQPKASISGSKYDPNHWQQMSKNWVIMNAAGHVVAFTLEVAWNTPHSTADGYREVGRKLGLALERYFRENPRK